MPRRAPAGHRSASRVRSWPAAPDSGSGAPGRCRAGRGSTPPPPLSRTRAITVRPSSSTTAPTSRGSQAPTACTSARTISPRRLFDPLSDRPRSSASPRTPPSRSTARLPNRSPISRSDRCSARRRKRPDTIAWGSTWSARQPRAQPFAACRSSPSVASRSRPLRRWSRPAPHPSPSSAICSPTAIQSAALVSSCTRSGDSVRSALARRDVSDAHSLTADAARGQDARVIGAASRIAVACAVLLVVIVFSTRRPDAAPSTAFELPAPTGRYAVGTTGWRLVDQSRPETLGAADELRNVEVLAWYPAQAPARAERAPCLREGVAEVRTFATLFRAPESSFDALAAVRTHSEVDAVPAGEPRRFPLLVFSVGFTGIASYATALLEDLASHGYVVLNVVHPYEVTAATLADGRIVTPLDSSGAPRQPIRDVFAEWAPEDDTMAAVTRASDEDEQRRLTRQFLRTLANTDAVVRRWVADTRLVLDRLAAMPATSPAGRLAARVDLSRLGVFGHSMGGVTAAQFCVEDRRCRAGLNLDGIPQYGTMIDAKM